MGDRPVPSAVLAARVEMLTARVDMLINEMREYRRECVPRGEWELARSSVADRLSVIETQLSAQSNRRWQLIALGIGAAFTAFAGLMITAVTIAFRLTSGS